ncbi:MAG: acetate--CoA ligase family protein, partial [Thermoplasmata archaeon]|nr:acetate--CoA ligase family protein [Thermoplasmata archaeon]
MTVGRPAPLPELFQPRSVAVIGASNRPTSVGAALFRNILTAGYQGVVYPVNPTAKSISGVRCYADIDALPETPDLAVVIVPAPSVAGVVDQLGRRGTRGAVVISAGFREVGGEGIAREAELVAAARRHRMSLVGPNCFGVLNTDPKVALNATFSQTLPARGNIAFVSQSGALCAGILQYALTERIGFSQFVSVGNRAGVDENDILQSFAEDPSTQVILLYIESLASGRRFLETAREITEHKPILVIKSGRSAAGERAARSHTGSLARSGQDRLFDALFEQSGVLRADTIGDLFRMAKMFATGLRMDGPRLAILTNSGGPGIVAADACARLGLELPEPSESVRSALAETLSPSSSLGNPVDMTADAQPAQYVSSLQRLLSASEFHGALVIATPTGAVTGRAVADAILEGLGHTDKPVAACLFGLSDLTSEVQYLESHRVPTFTFPEEAVSGLASLARYHAWRARPHTEVRHFAVDATAVAETFADAARSGTTVLPEFAARRLLEAYGIPFATSRRVRTEEEAVRAAQEIGYPVVLKVASPDISHKTDVGGVALNLAGPEALRTAFGTMKSTLTRTAPSARIEGFELEAMIGGGKEVLVGVQRDP